MRMAKHGKRRPAAKTTVAGVAVWSQRHIEQPTPCMNAPGVCGAGAGGAVVVMLAPPPAADELVRNKPYQPHISASPEISIQLS